MKHSGILFSILLSLLFLSFSTSNTIAQEQPKIGDILIVSENTGNIYKHIDFPRLNSVAKKTGLASYKSVHYIEVEITEIAENKHGKQYVNLKRVDGKSFFNLKKTVTANYQKAISSGELKVKS